MDSKEFNGKEEAKRERSDSIKTTDSNVSSNASGQSATKFSDESVNLVINKKKSRTTKAAIATGEALYQSGYAVAKGLNQSGRVAGRMLAGAVLGAETVAEKTTFAALDVGALAVVETFAAAKWVLSDQFAKKGASLLVGSGMGLVGMITRAAIAPLRGVVDTASVAYNSSRRSLGAIERNWLKIRAGWKEQEVRSAINHDLRENSPMMSNEERKLKVDKFMKSRRMVMDALRNPAMSKNNADVLREILQKEIKQLIGSNLTNTAMVESDLAVDFHKKLESNIGRNNRHNKDMKDAAEDRSKKRVLTNNMLWNCFSFGYEGMKAVLRQKEGEIWTQEKAAARLDQFVKNRGGALMDFKARAVVGGRLVRGIGDASEYTLTTANIVYDAKTGIPSIEQEEKGTVKLLPKNIKGIEEAISKIEHEASGAKLEDREKKKGRIALTNEMKDKDLKKCINELENGFLQKGAKGTSAFVASPGHLLNTIRGIFDTKYANRVKEETEKRENAEKRVDAAAFTLARALVGFKGAKNNNPRGKGGGVGI
jgi:hypothetical protein